MRDWEADGASEGSWGEEEEMEEEEMEEEEEEEERGNVDKEEECVGDFGATTDVLRASNDGRVNGESG